MSRDYMIGAPQAKDIMVLIYHMISQDHVI